MTLLDERELTADERAAIADEARPGVWIEEAIADGRTLSQHETDVLIAHELFKLALKFNLPHRRELIAAIAAWDEKVHIPDKFTEAYAQRGGIASDPPSQTPRVPRVGRSRSAVVRAARPIARLHHEGRLRDEPPDSDEPKTHRQGVLKRARRRDHSGSR